MNNGIGSTKVANDGLFMSRNLKDYFLQTG